MLGAEEFVLNGDADSELLSNLADEGILERFAGLDFPSRKFPQAWKVNVVKAARDEDCALTPDDRRDDSDDHGAEAAFRYGRKSSRQSLRRRKSMKRRYSFSRRRKLDARLL